MATSYTLKHLNGIEQPESAALCPSPTIKHNNKIISIILNCYPVFNLDGAGNIFLLFSPYAEKRREFILNGTIIANE